MKKITVESISEMMEDSKRMNNGEGMYEVYEYSNNFYGSNENKVVGYTQATTSEESVEKLNLDTRYYRSRKLKDERVFELIKEYSKEIQKLDSFVSSLRKKSIEDINNIVSLLE